MIADMLIHKKLNPVVTELFIRGRKLNKSLAFITQYYFVMPKKYFIMKNSNKSLTNCVFIKFIRYWF